jgi:diacylglycerol kinase (ATP)
VQIALHGSRRKLDVGVVNGERFAVMAGTGLDALIMRAVDGARKRQLGRLAYVRAGVRAARARRVRVHVRVDGNDWFEGLASAVLIGNIGTMTGGLTAFPQASPSDGLLEIGVVTAKSAWEWLRVLSRTVGGRPDHSRFVELSRGKKIVIELSRKRPYELDGGVRKPKKRLKIHLEPAALTVCVPRAPSRPKPTPPPRRRTRLPPR